MIVSTTVLFYGQYQYLFMFNHKMSVKFKIANSDGLTSATIATNLISKANHFTSLVTNAQNTIHT